MTDAILKNEQQISHAEKLSSKKNYMYKYSILLNLFSEVLSTVFLHGLFLIDIYLFIGTNKIKVTKIPPI